MEKLISLPLNDLESALSFMKENQYEASVEQMDAWVRTLLRQPQIVCFLLEKVKQQAPLKRGDLEFPLRGLGEGYEADDDYMRYDFTDPRNLLLELASRLNGHGQSKLFGLPGAEAYFMEVAKTGKTLAAHIQNKLLEQDYGKVVLKMYVYQGGKLCEEVKEQYTVGDLLYGVEA